ncbi:hypothetical protein VIGAN_08286200, partial [Vigna angularis var. angularis]
EEPTIYVKKFKENQPKEEPTNFGVLYATETESEEHVACEQPSLPRHSFNVVSCCRTTFYCREGGVIVVRIQTKHRSS